MHIRIEDILNVLNRISLFLLVTISCFGLFFVFSATYKPECHYSDFFKKQLFGIVSGFLLYFVCCTLDYRKAIQWGYVLYIAVIMLLFLYY